MRTLHLNDGHWADIFPAQERPVRARGISMKVLKVATAMALATACGPQTASDNVVQRYEIQTSALSTYNGVSYNGISYGGFSLRYASGLGPNGTSLYDTDAVHLQSTLLTAIESELDLTEPTQLQLSGALEDGRNVDLRIDDVQVREDGRNSYLVSIGAGGEWTSLCGLDEDGVARRAITVPGFCWRAGGGSLPPYPPCQSRWSAR
ncbi:MAG: hypothetical protein AAF449_16805 [Myxococcota bacterium]